MDFRIAAAGSLGNRPDPGKRAYRLRCRFRIGAFPSDRQLAQAKFAAADRFVADMRKQGYEYVDRYGFRMTGPYTPVRISTIRRPERLTARQMLPGVLAGQRFRAPEETLAVPVLSPAESERWEFELAGVFVHTTILTEQPDEVAR